MTLPAAFGRSWALALLSVALASPATAEQGRASFYGSEMHGRTASGAAWRPLGLSAAHRTLPLGTRLQVCFRGCVRLTINDRGPAKRTGRFLDLSRGAARAIGPERVGVAVVTFNVF